ncbi:hypothetical protein [Nonomuraea sp. SBT364]|uniref:hypothetical protein n=1 Tax=Nonomuraea sp. SBT364 TaxID=1580530 RepID=UPI00066E014F|nr:hypothetical protein [Nonomuraea sp. SBT364]
MFTRTAAKLLTLAVTLAGAATVALAAAPAAGAQAAHRADWGSEWDHCDLWSRYGGLYCHTGHGYRQGNQGGLLGGLLGL